MFETRSCKNEMFHGTTAVELHTNCNNEEKYEEKWGKIPVLSAGCLDALIEDAAEYVEDLFFDNTEEASETLICRTGDLYEIQIFFVNTKKYGDACAFIEIQATNGEEITADIEF